MLEKIISFLGLVSYKRLIRPLLFWLTKRDPEIAHQWVIRRLRQLGRHILIKKCLRWFTTEKDLRLRQTVCGLNFPRPIGLAEGFVKDPLALPGLAALGPGFIIAGSYTAKEQAGNPRPRIWRFPKQGTLINFMGLPNVGAEKAAEEFREFRELTEKYPGLKPNIPIGISISMSAGTTPERAPADYCQALEYLYPHGDFIVINISCPNSVGIAALQGKEFANRLLEAIMRMVKLLVARADKPPKPIFVKVSPDLLWEELNDFLEVCQKYGVNGIIAVNTTIKREGLKGENIPDKGGMSGPLLYERACEFIRYIRQKAPKLIIVGVGGINTGKDAFDMILAGANLVMAYTGFVYQGPMFFRSVNCEILREMEKDKIPHIIYLHSDKPKP
ncbi:MAG: dihydroorotate dehydrogenase (quinone) [Candidatus Omnitrophica bacterium CG1_02_49_16]|nr:MAG: dihydroorotate dehydrogenase (quinone) [Candidatus Omnitrophica bacterium CG1_02_49_16]